MLEHIIISTLFDVLFGLLCYYIGKYECKIHPPLVIVKGEQIDGHF